MSSYKKATKSLKRSHRERAQPDSRKHLGLLEKHKDYVLRARDYHRKQAHLKLLHEKARNRNPDEFYYKMVNTKLKGGRHVVAQPDEKYSEDELKMMKTQDEKYVRMKLNMEKMKVQKLQASLHKTSSRPNSHIMFVDPDDIDSPDTSPTASDDIRPHSLIDSTEQTQSDIVPQAQSDPVAQEQAHSYKELRQREHRCRELTRIANKMSLQKHLMAKGKFVKVAGDDSKPASYKWKKERKK